MPNNGENNMVSEEFEKDVDELIDLNKEMLKNRPMEY